MAQTLRLTDEAKEELARLKEKSIKEKTDNGAINEIILKYPQIQKQLEIELKRANKFEQLFYDLRDNIKQRAMLAKKLKKLIE
jgi:hypothetical protein